MTANEAQLLFRDVSRRGFLTSYGDVVELPFDRAEGNCDLRAHHMALQLISVGLTCKKIYAVCTPSVDGESLWIRSETSRGGRPGQPVEVEWEFHVAVAVDVQSPAGGTTEMVIDPSISPSGPITTGQWLAAMHVRSRERLVRLGESYREVEQKLRVLRPHAPPNVDNGGYPARRTSVFATEPEVVNRPELDPDTGARRYPEDAPPGHTMDDAHEWFLANRQDLEGQVEASTRRKRAREILDEVARVSSAPPHEYEMNLEHGAIARRRREGRRQIRDVAMQEP